MHGVMFPIVGSVYLVSYYEDIDEFCATVEIEVPQNVSHVQLQLEKFGASAYARNLINPKPGPVSIGVLGLGKPSVKFGDEIQGVLVQSLDLGPILQASDSLSPRVPGSARRPFLKFAPEPWARISRLRPSYLCASPI